MFVFADAKGIDAGVVESVKSLAKACIAKKVPCLAVLPLAPLSFSLSLSPSLSLSLSLCEPVSQSASLFVWLFLSRSPFSCRSHSLGYTLLGATLLTNTQGAFSMAIPGGSVVKALSCLDPSDLDFS